MNTLPALPFIISTGILLISTIILLYKKIRQEKFVKIIRENTKNAKDLWKTALENCADYVTALKLGEKDLENMENLNNVFVIKAPIGEVKIISKHTCGTDYGDSWRRILQVRSKAANLKTEGGGTSHIAVLNPDDHQSVLSAIKDGKVMIEIGPNIWP